MLTTGILWQCPCLFCPGMKLPSLRLTKRYPRQNALGHSALDIELVCRYKLVNEQPVSHSQCFDCMHSVLGAPHVYTGCIKKLVCVTAETEQASLDQGSGRLSSADGGRVRPGMHDTCCMHEFLHKNKFCI